MTLFPKFLSVLLLALAGNVSGNEPASLELKDLSGANQSLADYRGKVVVLNFWATWCEPCDQEMHDFVDARKKFPAEQVFVIAASLDDAASQKNIPKFAKRQKMSFPIWVG